MLSRSLSHSIIFSYCASHFLCSLTLFFSSVTSSVSVRLFSQLSTFTASLSLSLSLSLSFALSLSLCLSLCLFTSQAYSLISLLFCSLNLPHPHPAATCPPAASGSFLSFLTQSPTLGVAPKSPLSKAALGQLRLLWDVWEKSEYVVDWGKSGGFFLRCSLWEVVISPVSACCWWTSQFLLRPLWWMWTFPSLKLTVNL